MAQLAQDVEFVVRQTNFGPIEGETPSDSSQASDDVWAGDHSDDKETRSRIGSSRNENAKVRGGSHSNGHG